MKKVTKKKVIIFMLSGRSMRIHLIAGLIKKISLYKRIYFPEPYSRSKTKIKVKLDFSNYETKFD